MSSPLSKEQINEIISGLDGWSFQDDKLEKSFEFKSFKEAVSFIVRLGFEAEGQNHHPELRNVYNQVEVRLTTHDAGDKVTDRDVRLARAIESFAWR